MKIRQSVEKQNKTALPATGSVSEKKMSNIQMFSSTTITNRFESRLETMLLVDQKLMFQSAVYT